MLQIYGLPREIYCSSAPSVWAMQHDDMWRLWPILHLVPVAQLGLLLPGRLMYHLKIIDHLEMMIFCK